MLAKELRAFTVEAARLDDLYSPKRVEVTVQRSPAEIMDVIRAELAQLQQRQRPEHQLGAGVIDAEVI